MKQSIDNFLNSIYCDNEQRVINKRSIEKDITVFKENQKYLQIEQDLINKHYSEEYPIVFIVGVPRSGTTLLSQLLVDGYDLGYINNKNAKYYLAPIYSLTKFNQNTVNLSYESSLGNTEDINSPHEFGYFWHYWMNNPSNHQLSPVEVESVNWSMIKKELCGSAGYLEKPLLIKSIVYVNYHITKIREIFPNSIFIHIKRKSEFVCQSIIESRIKQYGDKNIWWSIKPENWKELNLQPVNYQVAYQYKSVLKSIEKSFEELKYDRCYTLNYEDIIKDVNHNLGELCIQLKFRKKANFKHEQLKNGNKMNMEEEEFINLIQIISQIKI